MKDFRVEFILLLCWMAVFCMIWCVNTRLTIERENQENQQIQERLDSLIQWQTYIIDLLNK
jgi:ABC-type transport system involved in Fe-S cluster assembly fused permease/ATPase subunit